MKKKTPVVKDDKFPQDGDPDAKFAWLQRHKYERIVGGFWGREVIEVGEK